MGWNLTFSTLCPEKKRAGQPLHAWTSGHICYCGPSQVSGLRGPALWRLGPGPRTGSTIPLGPFLQKTPAAVAQVYLTPDVVNKNGKEKKREHPPSLIPFGKSPGCQVPYIMPAQADTCAGAGAGSGSGGDSGLIG